MDLDNSVFVRLRIFGFLWIWIIGIVKVHTRGPFCNLTWLNRSKELPNRKYAITLLYALPLPYLQNAFAVLMNASTML